MKFLSTLIGFTLLQTLTATSGLLVLPLVARVASPAEWGQLAIGQAIGLLGAAAVSGGWAIEGPKLVAAAEDSERAALLRVSTLARAGIWLLLLPALMAGTAVLTGTGIFGFGPLMAAASSASGLSIMWFAVGVGSPALALFVESLPKLLVTASTASMIYVLELPLALYPSVLLVQTGLTAAIALACMRSSEPMLLRVCASRAFHTTRAQLPATAVQVVGSSYGAATAALVGIGASNAATGVFSSADKVYRLALLSVVALGNTLQGWISGSERDLNERMARSLLVLTLVGLAGATSLVWIGPSATRVAFGGELAADRLTFVGFGIAFAGVSLGTAAGRLMLVPLRKTKPLLGVTIGLAVLGCPAIAASSFLSVSTSALVYGVVELSGAIVMLVLAKAAARRRFEDASGVKSNISH